MDDVGKTRMAKFAPGLRLEGYRGVGWRHTANIFLVLGWLCKAFEAEGKRRSLVCILFDIAMRTTGLICGMVL